MHYNNRSLTLFWSLWFHFDYGACSSASI